MNLIEQFIVESIPLKTWKRACSASPEAHEICGWWLAATGLIDDGVDVSTGGEHARDYVAAYFAAAEKFNKAA